MGPSRNRGSARRGRALLLGRRSDEWFASRWQAREGEWADKLNSLPKYVASSTPTEPKWSNSTVISGDVLSQVAELKQQVSGEILVYGSYQLAHTLIEHDLVDEIRLVVFPVLLGAGERLFGQTGAKKPLRLINLSTIGKGLAFVTYARGQANGAHQLPPSLEIGRCTQSTSRGQ